MRLVYFFGLLGGLMLACGGEDGEAPGSGSAELAFHAEANPLEGFSYDSGFKGAAGVEAQFLFASQAKLSVDTSAVPLSGDRIAGKPGSGNVALDAKLSLQVNLKVDVASGAVTYDGPVPGLDAIDIRFAGNQPFEPFALEQPAAVTVNLPETKLPDVPIPSLPGGVLSLTVQPSSTMTSSFKATCVANDGENAELRGGATTQGTLTILPKIILDVPLLGPQEFPLPEIAVPVPGLAARLDFGTKPVTGVGPAPAGAAIVERASCEEEGGGSSSGGASSGGSSSSSGGSSGSSGSSGASSSSGGVTPVGTWSVRVDGVQMTPTHYYSYIDTTTERPRHNAFLYFQGPGFGPSSTVTILAFDPGQGCGWLEGLSLLPDDGTQRTFLSSSALAEDAPPEPCGLTITTANDRYLRGAFTGTVLSSDQTEQRELEVVFDLERTP